MLSPAIGSKWKYKAANEVPVLTVIRIDEVGDQLKVVFDEEIYSFIDNDKFDTFYSVFEQQPD